MRWVAIAPFFTSPDARWLTPPSPNHQVKAIQKPSSLNADWHRSKRKTTSASGWRGHWAHATVAMRSAPDGIITVFPQLAAVVGLRKRLTRSRMPVVAWCFNIGQLSGGPKRLIARRALQEIDCFVVHTRLECERYSSWFDLPLERFQFVPMQQGKMEPVLEEDRREPFLLAMGSAHRDYRALFEAVAPLGLRTVVVASPRSLEGLTVPDCVEVRSGMTLAACRDLARKARLSVVPLNNDKDVLAAGQVTIVDAMWLGCPVIASNCFGTEDYIDSGTDGLLVDHGDPAGLRDAILKLWDDPGLRDRMAQAAYTRAIEQYSDQAAGAALGQILDQFMPHPTALQPS